MLYYFAFMTFFSWPILLPYLSTIIRNPTSYLPRVGIFCSFTIIAILMIHFNTLVHPFTLADNRHYPFYVFRYFIIPQYRKYFLAPIYVLCGWLCILALSPSSTAATARIATTKASTDAKGHQTIEFARQDTVHVSFVIVFLASTTLSLVTAPLVEPRYFLIPWLIWRMHVPETLASDAPRQKALEVGAKSTPAAGGTGALGRLVDGLASHALSLELVWYTVINVLTGYMFLTRTFEWSQEPGMAQRFMW
jgi:alpha-1,2-glucosyltransferase